MNIEQLAEKHAKDYPGFILADFYEAAFPVYVMNLKTLVQAQREIPILWEFILKSIEAGQNKVSDIAGILGLEYQVVESGLDELQRQKFIQFIGLSKKLNETKIQLSTKGHLALKDLFFKEPEISILKILMDGITGELTNEKPLRLSKDVRNYNYHEIPSFVSIPDMKDIEFAKLKRIVNKRFSENIEFSIDKEKKEIIDLVEIEKTWTEYQILRVLQFIRPEDGVIQVQIYDRADRLRDHESIVLSMEEKKLRPLRAYKENEVPHTNILEIESIVDKNRIDAARKLAQKGPIIESSINSKKEEIKNLESSKETQIPEERNEINYFKQKHEKEIQELQNEIEELRKKSGEVEVLQMYQHRNLLLDALNDSADRVIIVSPWINLDAINFEFQNHLQTALKKNIDIYIIYGFGDKKNVEEKALRRLNLIKNKATKGRLHLNRMNEIHSKVLICDDKYLIITSFNWLSFAGDPQRGVRFEDGIKTTNKEAIVRKTKEWLEKIKNQNTN